MQLKMNINDFITNHIKKKPEKSWDEQLFDDVNLQDVFSRDSFVQDFNTMHKICADGEHIETEDEKKNYIGLFLNRLYSIYDDRLRIKLRNGLCLFVSIAVVLSQITPVFAETSAASYSKNEAIYVNLKADGSIDGSYVVNIFELNEAGEIKDYGNYSELRNMTGEEEILYDNGRVSINTESDTLYYEGTLQGNPLPWNFDIKYYLDGEELSADKIAGMSGALKITLGISENTDAKEGFFDNFALQITLTFDSRYAKNIVSEGATIADVGRDKQLTWIAIPGIEREYEITADVSNFSMDGFSINGIKMNMGLTDDLFDTNTLIGSKLDELISGVKELDSGAAELLSGSAELVEGTKTLSDGAKSLYDGMETLYDGAGTLSDAADDLADGASSIRSGARSLQSGAEEAEAGASELKWGLSTLYSGVSALSDAGNQMEVLAEISYNRALKESAICLALAGYYPKEDSNAEEIYEMLTDRASKLTDEDTINQAKLDAINSLLGVEIAKSEPNENIVMYLHVAACALRFQMAGDDLAKQYEITSDYSDMLIDIGGINMLETKYQELSMLPECKEVYASLEQTVTDMMTELVKSDQIYADLAMLYYCRIFDTFNGNIEIILAGAQQLYQGSSTLNSGLSLLSSGLYSLRIGADEFKEGAEEFEDGADTLKDGVKEAQDGAMTLYEGTQTVYNGAVSLHDGCMILKDGTNELKVGVQTMTDHLAATIIEAVNDMFGADFITPSFTDERNNQFLESVEFVFQTEAIKIPTVTVVDAVAPKLTLWQKLVALFK